MKETPHEQIQICKERIELSGELTIRSASTLWPAALAAVRAHGGNAILEMRQVSAIDTSGLQILLMLRRLALASGTRFEIVEPSHVVRQVLELCALQDTIADVTELAS